MDGPFFGMESGLYVSTGGSVSLFLFHQWTTLGSISGHMNLLFAATPFALFGPTSGPPGLVGMRRGLAVARLVGERPFSRPALVADATVVERTAFR